MTNNTSRFAADGSPSWAATGWIVSVALATKGRGSGVAISSQWPTTRQGCNDHAAEAMRHMIRVRGYMG